MTKILVFFLISVYVGFNLVVCIKYTAKEMCKFLFDEQNLVGKICGNIFYLPAWLLKAIFCPLWYYTKKSSKWLFYAVARFLQQAYHSIFDLV